MRYYLIAIFILSLSPVMIFAQDIEDITQRDYITKINSKWMIPLSDMDSLYKKPGDDDKRQLNGVDFIFDRDRKIRSSEPLDEFTLSIPMNSDLWKTGLYTNNSFSLSEPQNKLIVTEQTINKPDIKGQKDIIAGLTLEEWKLLEGPIEKRDRSLLYPISYHLFWYGLIIGAGFIYYDLYRPEVLNWQGISVNRMIKNITSFNWHWDGDRIFFNYVAHPIMGSEAYLRVRMRGFEWYESLLFAFIASSVWEFTEALVEQISIQDMFVTPISGMVLGEMRFKAKLWLKKQDSVLADIGVVLVDPFQSLVEALYSLISDPSDVSLPEVRVQFFYQTGNYRFTF